MARQEIESPGFQRLHALKEFEFHHLNPVGCNICRSVERDVLFAEGVFEVLRCRNCGLLYVSPQPSETDLREYYRHFFPGTAGQDQGRWRNIESFVQAHGYLRRFLPDRNSDILEVGCGYGYFLELLHRKGYRKTTGIEPDEQSCNVCKRRNPDAEIINSDFLSHDFRGRKFDTIVMLASLEHFSDPLHILKKNYGLLKEGGLIIIRVPCLEGFFRINRFIGKRVVPFGAPRHLYDLSVTKIEQCAVSQIY